MKIFKEFFQKRRKTFLATLTVSTTICIIYLYLLVKVLLNSTEAANERADVIIILGHGVTEELKPSPWLYERLMEGLHLFESGFAEKIIVTGGRGPLDTIPVAYVMKYFLISRGVNEKNILVEANSRDTFENFSYSKIIAKENEIHSIIFVTNNFHIFRSKRMAMLFFENVEAHSAPAERNFALTMAYLREPVSIIYNSVSSFFRATN